MVDERVNRCNVSKWNQQLDLEKQAQGDFGRQVDEPSWKLTFLIKCDELTPLATSAHSTMSHHQINDWSSNHGSLTMTARTSLGRSEVARFLRHL
jgi:hypothetical protein